MAQDTIGFLEGVLARPTHLLGCSDGATVALVVALRRPDLIRRLILVAGVFHHNGWHPQAIDPNNEPPEFLARLHGEVSADGAAHCPTVVVKLARMHSHGLLVEKPHLCNDVILEFLTTDPVPTVAPIRRDRVPTNVASTDRSRPTERES